MNIVDPEKMIDGFDMLVNLRFRVQFYMDYINAPSGIGHLEYGNEHMFNHFQMVRSRADFLIWTPFFAYLGFI
jgi:hypothetical protein